MNCVIKGQFNKGIIRILLSFPRIPFVKLHMGATTLEASI